MLSHLEAPKLTCLVSDVLGATFLESATRERHWCTVMRHMDDSIHIQSVTVPLSHEGRLESDNLKFYTHVINGLISMCRHKLQLKIRTKGRCGQRSTQKS